MSAEDWLYLPPFCQLQLQGEMNELGSSSVPCSTTAYNCSIFDTSPAHTYYLLSGVR